jgi:hypothetical protein
MKQITFLIQLAIVVFPLGEFLASQKEKKKKKKAGVEFFMKKMGPSHHIVTKK